MLMKIESNVDEKSNTLASYNIWWRSKYSPNQSEKVNSAVEKVLNRSNDLNFKNKEDSMPDLCSILRSEDTEDDVFFGIEEESRISKSSEQQTKADSSGEKYKHNTTEILYLESKWNGFKRNKERKLNEDMEPIILVQKGNVHSDTDGKSNDSTDPDSIQLSSDSEFDSFSAVGDTNMSSILLSQEQVCSQNMCNQKENINSINDYQQIRDLESKMFDTKDFKSVIDNREAKALDFEITKETVSVQEIISHLEHQRQSHEIFSMNASTKLLIPPLARILQKGRILPPSSHVSRNNEDTKLRDFDHNFVCARDQHSKMKDTNNIQCCFSDNKYKSDGKNDHSKQPVGTSLISLENRTHNVKKKLKGNAQMFTKLHKITLKQFCVRMKNQAIHVLKLNRENKWQTRFLTISKEGEWLRDDHSEFTNRQSFFLPMGILWEKKFTLRQNGYSITNISTNGNGGILLSQISKVQKENSCLKISLSKEQDKFVGSSIIRIYREGRSSGVITIRCTKSDTAYIISGFNSIIDTLRNKKQEYKT